MIEKRVQSANGPVYYWTNDFKSQQDFAIVFCHGLTADHTLFTKQIEHLSTEYKLITWDIPLHGKSRPYKNFSFANVNRELLTILEQENLNRIVVVGQSAGGYIAQSFIEENGNKVIGFIGVGTTPFGKYYYKKSELFWLKHYSTIARLYPYRFYCRAGAKAITETKEARASMYKSLINLGKKDMLKATSAVYEEFLKINNEVHFTCPVLITFGENDRTGYVKQYCQAWAAKTGFRLEIIPNASHNANYDNYEEFNNLLNSFIHQVI
ncbi:alpha/beta fold hydrolase [Metabacillus malikii]|uniref:Pimeloyl-ACP methyl ester carboxylesterase n=1 Tax=Metabacillus malikii TaxID=1504265 RepID=A0ABT9ZM32_9BACI|nr:alpha/beta hydrolase [Metabacillus malikii]MDQ0233327.1 pimeloyl-ACP methyl ester carboxylesterase [Metabacillus malikii]